MVTEADHIQPLVELGLCVLVRHDNIGRGEKTCSLFRNTYSIYRSVVKLVQEMF